MTLRALRVCVICACLAGGVAMAQPAAPPLVLLDGEPAALQAPAVMVDGQVFIWVRDLARIAGGVVYVRSDDGAAVIRRDGAWIAFTPGRAEADAPWRVIPLPAAVRAIEGKVMVPLETSCRALGIPCSVEQRTVASISRGGDLPSRGGPRRGSITGRVTFNHSGKAGVRLRLVRAEDFTFVPGARALSGAAGEYEFRAVPAGVYHVYAYVGDNPRYFNRHVGPAVVRGGAASVDDLELGLVLQALEPQPGAVVSAEGELLFRWSDCPGAAQYAFSISDEATGEQVYSIVTEAPLAAVVGRGCPSPPNPAAGVGTPALHSPLRLSAARTYRWEVRAAAADGSFLGGSPGAGGRPWTFSVR